MRLYLQANSKMKIGYTLDWLKVQFTENEKEYELTLDFQGESDYANDTLSCCCKGELIPWVLWDLKDGTEIDLYELSVREVNDKFSKQRIAEIIFNSKHYEIGICPATDSFELAEMDTLTECCGSIDIYIDKNNCYTKEFRFDTQLNI